MQRGKTVVITGTGGLGFETALFLAGAGARVILAGRNGEKGSVSVSKIKNKHPGAEISFMKLNLADLSSVNSFTEALTARNARLDVLINNAGIMSVPERQTTADGFELQFGTNFLGHFALTMNLLPLLQSSAARVISLSSIAHRQGKIHFNNLQLEGDYKPFKAYAQSKLACLMFAAELQRRSDKHGWNISSVGVHPGVAATDLFSNMLKNPALRRVAGRVLQTPEQGARAIIFAATDEAVRGGMYYGPTGFFEFRGKPKLCTPSPRACDSQSAARLWEMAEEMIKAARIQSGANFTEQAGRERNADNVSRTPPTLP